MSYEMEKQNVVRRDLSPGQAVWTVDRKGRAGVPRRVLRPGGLVGFDEYQPRAWQEVKDLFDVSRLSTPETANGPGSTIELTLPIREWLPEVFERYAIRTMLDAPCGDWTWMRFIDLNDISYVGWDVVPALIEQCALRAAESGDAPHAMFECVNLLTVPQVPCVDLILSRDFLAHLPNEPAERVLNKFKMSGSTYLLASNYPDKSNDFVYDPRDYHWIGYAERPINLEKPPFSLGPKLASCPELPGPAGVIAQPHELALFRLADDA